MNQRLRYPTLMLVALALVACPCDCLRGTPDNHLLSLKTRVFLDKGDGTESVPRGEKRALAKGDVVDVDNSGHARLHFSNYLLAACRRKLPIQAEP